MNDTDLARKDSIVAFIHLMSKVNSALRTFMRHKFKTHCIDITFEMLQVLRFLWEKDGVNQQEIADAIIKDKASLTYLIDNLVRRKLVKRTPDHQDRRNKIIVLTAGGHQLGQQIIPWLNEMYQIASKGIDSALLQSGISLGAGILGNFDIQKGN